MGFQTAFRPRPVFNERPPMPVVPIERVRPILKPPVQAVEARKPPEPPKPASPILVHEEDLAKWQEASELDALASHNLAMDIVAAIACVYDVDSGHIFWGRRTKAIAAARQRSMAAIYTALPHWPLTKIGMFFKRDHTTVLHAVKKQGVWRQ